MYQKALYVFFAILFSTVIFCNQSAQATVNFPNTSVFTTYTFTLDLDDNGELVTITRYQNLDDNFDWYSYTPLEIPMQITSFSKEKPNLTEVSVGDNSSILNYSIRNYTISPLQSDSTYIHEYVIEVSPKSSGYCPFLKNQIITIKTRTNINQLSSQMGDSGKLIYYLPKNYPPFIQSFIIKVNLPNDPYYWEEILATFPKDDYRASYGRGYTAEWWYKAGSPYISPIIIDYKIHQDSIKRDLDNAAMNSLEYAKKADFWGFIALIIALISIPSVIWSSRDFINWIKEKINNRP